MKIVITGANGFVGAALCRYFSKAGHSVIAVGRQVEPPANLLKYATYIPADISTTLPLIEAHVCIHAAGLASDTATYPELYQNNVTGTKNILAAAANCQYFIQISSSSVYNFGSQPMLEHEASLEANLSDYGQTKLLAELLVQEYIPVNQKRLILRPRAIYGLGDRVLLPRLLKLVNRNKLYCPVPPDIQTSLTHVENIAYAISLFLQKENPAALQVYNIADEPGYNLRESAIQILEAVNQKPLKLITVPAAALKALVSINNIVPISPNLNPFVLGMLTKHSVLDISKIKKELNFAPAHTFNNTISDISQWITGMGGLPEYKKSYQEAPWNIPN